MSFNEQYNLFGKKVSDTYPNLLQSGSDGIFYDGTGNSVTINATIPDIYVLTSSFNSFTSSYNTGSFTGSFTGSLFGTASWATNASTASFAATASFVSSNFQYEIHVSQVDGNDTTGNGDLLKPVATIGKALLLVSASVASTDRRTIIVHPGTYIENITINTTNTYFFSTGVLGANCLISGSVTISAATRMSGLKMTNLIVSSSAPVYINNCAVDKQMTVSGSGYLEVQNTSLQCTSGIQVVGPASSGVIFENCSLYPLTVNNASAAVYVISCNQAITPTLTAGALTITRSTISSLTSGATSTALTTAAGSVLVLESCNVYNSLLTSHAAITANGFYSIKNVIYNRSASTLASLSGTGGPLATVSQFQYINADNINSTQGLTVTGSINVSGSVINNLTASYATQALSASFATSSSLATDAQRVITVQTTTGTGPYYPVFATTSGASTFLRTDPTTFTYDATANTLTVTASSATTASFALSASFVQQAVSASYAITASFIETKTVFNQPILGTGNVGFVTRSFSQSIGSNATGETQLLQIPIPANTFSATDKIAFFATFNKTGTANASTLRIKISTSSSMPTGSTSQIAQYTSANTSLFAKINRELTINGGTLKGFPFTISTNNDANISTTSITSSSFDVTQLQYVYVSISPAALTTDVSYLEGFELRNF